MNLSCFGLLYHNPCIIAAPYQGALNVAVCKDTMIILFLQALLNIFKFNVRWHDDVPILVASCLQENTALVCLLFRCARLDKPSVSVGSNTPQMETL